ncbi:hypothetical protein LTR17_007876 [Elasticomyces elasticus]|nr:hypothetical protein LTR17_007876 [Elasticomyces elasticus]
MTDPNLNTHTFEDSEDEVASAVGTVLAHRDKLKDIISRPAMSHHDEWQESDQRQLKALLADIEALRVLRPETQKNLQGSTSHSVTGKAVVEAFKTAELLESVLQHLTIPELHNAEDTCRLFRDTIASSPKLLQKLFRTLVTSHKLRTPGYLGPFDHTNPWLRYSISCFSALTEPGAYYPYGPETFLVCFEARFQSCTGALPQLPNRVLEMFVSQPPITKAQIFLACCGRMPFKGDADGNAIYTLCNANGFKLKDFYTDGFVQNTATFVGQYLDHGPTTLSPVDGNMYHGRLPADDPAWSPHVQFRKKTEEEDAVMAAYMAAKMHAHWDRQPVFTLEEFKARTAAESPGEGATISEGGIGE